MPGAAHLRLALVAALLGLAVLVVRPAERPAPPALTATAAGDMRVESTQQDRAIIDVENLKPGDSASGTLTLSNRAGVEQQLRLSTVGLVDRPGPGGGKLSERLAMTVERLSGGRQVVYDGTVDGLETLDLGVMPAAGSHAYRFTVALPEDGPALDDAYAGAGVELGWRWTADADPETLIAPVDPAPAGAGTPAPPAPSAPSGSAPPSQPEPSGGSSLGPREEGEGPAPGEDRPVRLWIGGAPVQRLAAARGARSAARRTTDFAVLVRCRPACSVVAGGRVRVGRRWVTLRSRRLGAARATGAPAKLVFRLTAAELRRLAPALRGRRAVSAQLTLRASAPGHVDGVAARTVRLRR